MTGMILLRPAVSWNLMGWSLVSSLVFSAILFFYFSWISTIVNDEHSSLISPLDKLDFARAYDVLRMRSSSRDALANQWNVYFHTRTGANAESLYEARSYFTRKKYSKRNHERSLNTFFPYSRLFFRIIIVYYFASSQRKLIPPFWYSRENSDFFFHFIYDRTIRQNLYIEINGRRSSRVPRR